MPRWIQPSLLCLVVIFTAFALLERSNGPFLSPRFAQTIARAEPLPPISTLVRLPQGNRAITDSVDALSEGLTHLVVAGAGLHTFRFHGSSPTEVDGWAIEQDLRLPAAGIVARIDGHPIAVTKIGSMRSDVAAAFADPAFLPSGFHLEIPAASISRGRHALSFLIISARRDAATVVAPKLFIERQ